MQYKKEFDSVSSLIKETGKELLQKNQLDVISNEGKDVKAVADIETEKKLIKGIESFSKSRILSEESYKSFKSDVSEDPYWIVDPIDGTLNYLRSIPMSCISVALWHGDKPIFGVVYDFNRDEMIRGYVGEGAWFNNDKLYKPPEIAREQSVLGTGITTYMNLEDGSLEELISNIIKYKKIRMLGSAAVMITYVGLNRFNAYMEKDIKLWDIAAGLAILKALNIPYNIEETQNYGYDVFAYNHKNIDENL